MKRLEKALTWDQGENTMNANLHYRRMLLLCILTFCIAARAEAAADWALKVVSIECDGRAVDTARPVTIYPPGKEKGETRMLGKGSGIDRGAEIVVPLRTVLFLISANGNSIRLTPGRYRVNVVSGDGESYTVLLGQAFFKVIKKLNFFNVGYQSFYAFVPGTEFAVAVDPEKEIRFSLTEGKLVVQREVKVKIREGDKVAQLIASEVLSQGRKTEVSYRLGVEEYLREFKTYKDAEDYFRRQFEGRREEWGV